MATLESTAAETLMEASAPVGRRPAGRRQDMSNYTPLGAAVEAIQDSMQTGFPPARPLLVLVAYAVVFAVAARRFFRWE